MNPDDVAWNEAGLVAAIVQDATDGRVLMLGWMNRRALALTHQTGRVHFWSRSRQELWEKGATSGNYLNLASIQIDCDADALLVQAFPRGPVCHTGAPTCWGEQRRHLHDGLGPLWETIRSRSRERPPDSYTTSLLDGGVERVGRKVVEEATEVLLAAKDHHAGEADSRRVAEEAADLVYHLLVLLAERNVDLGEVFDVLRERRG
ncbi:MAG: bifunctional phosphoribosyl-AMP cyclohydrolase/phosphoribosyl-ATP diphosphatase HisIE [Acidimicrobiia bacterium]